MSQRHLAVTSDILATCDKLLLNLQHKLCGKGDGFLVVNALSRDLSVTKLVKGLNIAPATFYKHWYKAKCPDIQALKIVPFLYKVAVFRDLFGYTLAQIGAAFNVEGRVVNDKIRLHTGKYITAWSKHNNHVKVFSSYEKLLKAHTVGLCLFSFPIRTRRYEQLDLLNT